MAIEKPWKDWPDTDVEAGKWVKDQAYMLGYEDGSFKPNESITSLQMCAVLKRATIDAVWDSSNPTIADAQRYLPYAKVSSAPTDNLTRYRLAVMLYRHFVTPINQDQVMIDKLEQLFQEKKVTWNGTTRTPRLVGHAKEILEYSRSTAVPMWLALGQCWRESQWFTTGLSVTYNCGWGIKDDEDLLNSIEDREDDEHPAIARLIEFGRQKTYVTIDDILTFFPEAEQDVDQLEEAFAALISEGIAYVDEPIPGGPSDEELVEEEVEEEEVRRDLIVDDNYLANIDTDDTIGLYLKEVGRVPLLTAEEEVELAQRIERGRLAREELARGNVNPRRRNELEKLIEDGWAAREHLITANSRLVISVGKKYMGRGVPFLDLIQEGNIG